MGDLQHEKVGGEQDDLQNRDAQSIKTESPAVAEVRAMIASRVPHPTGIARILQKHPEAREEIMALVHQTLGNGFAMEVLAATKRDQQAPQSPGKAAIEETTAEVRKTDDAPTKYEAADGRILQKGHGPLPGSKNDPMVDNAVATTNGGGNDDKQRTKAQAAVAEMNASDQELGVGGSPKAAPKSPSKEATDQATAEVLKDDPLNRPGQSSKDRQLTAEMMDFETLPNNAHAENPKAPIETSKVLKDETVIASSAEVKPPAVLRASEVLKDPNEAEGPTKAADAAKDDDAENEGSGGAKADLGPVKITASVLRVRSSPKIGKGNIVGRLTKGTVVEAIGHSGDWVEIQYKGQTAFVHSSFVVSAQDAATPKAPDQAAAQPS